MVSILSLLYHLNVGLIIKPNLGSSISFYCCKLGWEMHLLKCPGIWFYVSFNYFISAERHFPWKLNKSFEENKAFDGKLVGILS